MSERDPTRERSTCFSSGTAIGVAAALSRERSSSCSSRVRSYTGPQEFSYPGGVRIAGKVRMFSLTLPAPDYPLLRSLPNAPSNGPLILPWEHASMDRLFLAKYQRFHRPKQELPRVRETLEAVFRSRLSGRTERRYRSPTASQPHVDALIQLTLANMARYTDSIRARRSGPSDRGRFSLDALLNARHLYDLPAASRTARLPVPSERWTALRKEYVEWPTLLSLKFPQLQAWDDRVVRLPQGSAIHGVDPAASLQERSCCWARLREHRTHAAMQRRRVGAVPLRAS